MYTGEIRECRLGMGVIKENGRVEVGEIPWFLFCPFIKYLTRYVFSNLLCRWKSSFSYIFSQNPAKSHVSTIFSENWFFAKFQVFFNASKFPRARWLYDVTVTSYEVQWYSFWYQWIEEGTLVTNIGVSGVPYRKSRRGTTTPPHSEDVLQKYLKRTRVNNIRISQSAYIPFSV